MRKISLVLLVATIAMASTCTKETDCCANPGDLFGTWKVVQQYYDIGSGTGQWNAYPEANYVSFYNDGRFTSTKPLPTTNFNRYKIKDASHVQFYNEGQQDTVTRKFQVENDHAILWMQCIEECKLKLARAVK